MSEKRGRTDFLPRGLSRVQAATYIGVSTSLFDQMVADGRMPPPREINSRRVWDRHQVDASFDDLPGGADQGEGIVGSSWDDLVETPAGASIDQQQDRDLLHEFYMTSWGYDPRGMSEEDKAVAETKRIATWTATVRASPLWKKEKFALVELLKTLGEWKSGMHIKGASTGTFERLDARGYVVMKMAPWHYADTGKLAPREGEHWQLTPEGEAAARLL